MILRWIGICCCFECLFMSVIKCISFGVEFGVKGFKNGILGWKIEGFPRIRLPILVQLVWRAQGELPSPAPMFWVVLDIPSRSGRFQTDSFDVFKLSKPFGNIKWIGLNLVLHNRIILLKMTQEHENVRFSENSFSQGKRVGLGLFTQESSNELDWTWFCTIISYFWKWLKKMRFSKNSFSQGKRVGLGLFTQVIIYKSVLDGNRGL